MCASIIPNSLRFTVFCITVFLLYLQVICGFAENSKRYRLIKKSALIIRTIEEQFSKYREVHLSFHGPSPQSVRQRSVASSRRFVSMRNVLLICNGRGFFRLRSNWTLTVESEEINVVRWLTVRWLTNGQSKTTEVGEIIAFFSSLHWIEKDLRMIYDDWSTTIWTWETLV